MIKIPLPRGTSETNVIVREICCILTTEVAEMSPTWIFSKEKETRHYYFSRNICSADIHSLRIYAITGFGEMVLGIIPTSFFNL